MMCETKGRRLNKRQASKRFRRLTRLQHRLEEPSVYERDHRRIAEVLEQRLEVLRAARLEGHHQWAREKFLEMQQS